MQVIDYGAYKDQKAVIFESERTRFAVLPDCGANLASAVLKSSGREFLVNRPEENFRRVPFDDLYTEGECSGMDDMFPTIDACYCERFPWAGVKLADHGEAWNLPCEVSIEQNAATFVRYGVRLPYVLTKKMYFLDEQTLRAEYEAVNRSEFPMDFLYACHTMLNAEPGLTLLTPFERARAQAVFSNTGRIGRYGEEFDYPRYTDAKGALRDISVMGDRDENCEKYYFKEKLATGYCGVRHVDGDAFELFFPEDKIPYLGILHNTGSFRGIYNIFIEPCSAPFDRPDIARAMGKGSVIPPRSSYTWHLDIRLTSGR